MNPALDFTYDPDGDFTIDPEFTALCRPLTAEERDILQVDILLRGCVDPLVAWLSNGERILLDGHHRLEICRSAGLLPIRFVEMQFASRAEALVWIAEHQRGRRNMTPEQLSYLRGKEYEAQKGSRGGDRGRKKPNRHSVGLNAAQHLATEHGVDSRTIERDAAFARNVDTIASNAGEEARAKILSGNAGASKRDVAKLAELPAAEQKAALANGKQGIKKAVNKPTSSPATADDEQVASDFRKLRSKLESCIDGIARCRQAAVVAELRKWLLEFERDLVATKGGRPHE